MLPRYQLTCGPNRGSFCGMYHSPTVLELSYSLSCLNIESYVDLTNQLR